MFVGAYAFGDVAIAGTSEEIYIDVGTIAIKDTGGTGDTGPQDHRRHRRPQETTGDAGNHRRHRRPQKATGTTGGRRKPQEAGVHGLPGAQVSPLSGGDFPLVLADPDFLHGPARSFPRDRSENLVEI